MHNLICVVQFEIKGQNIKRKSEHYAWKWMKTTSKMPKDFISSNNSSDKNCILFLFSMEIWLIVSAHQIFLTYNYFNNIFQSQKLTTEPEIVVFHIRISIAIQCELTYNLSSINFI